MTVVIPVMLILICVLYVLRWREDTKRKNESKMLSQFRMYVAAITEGGSDTNDLELGRSRDHELPLLSFPCIVSAIDNLSAANKTGEGGFVPVYDVNYSFLFKLNNEALFLICLNSNVVFGSWILVLDP